MKVTPVILLLLGVLVAFWPKPSVIVPVVFIAALWTLLAQGQAMKRLVISDDAIEMHGFFGGPVTITKENVAACRYLRATSRGRGPIDVSVLEITTVNGHGMRVWRHGWGRQRRQLFRLLGDWLASSGVSLDERTRHFLVAARE